MGSNASNPLEHIAVDSLILQDMRIRLTNVTILPSDLKSCSGVIDQVWLSVISLNPLFRHNCVEKAAQQG